MLSLSSSHPGHGAAWPQRSEVIAPQPILAGFGSHPIATESPEESEDFEDDDEDTDILDDDEEDDGLAADADDSMSQRDNSFMSAAASTSFGSQPASFSTQFSRHFGRQQQQQQPSTGHHGARQHLPMLNTSFSLAPAASSVPAHAATTTTSAWATASPLDTAASLTSATSNMPSLRGGPASGLKPTGSLSFADSLSTWSLDCVGPPLDDEDHHHHHQAAADQDEEAAHSYGRSYSKPAECLPQFNAWRETHHDPQSPWLEHAPQQQQPTPPPEPPRAHPGQSDLAPPHAPALEEQQIDPPEPAWERTKHLTDRLVEISMLAINSIWPADGAETKQDSVLPLDYFVREVISRSNAGAQVLQLALYYLHRARSGIRERVAHYHTVKARFVEMSLLHHKQQHGTDYPSPPSSPLEEKYRHAGAEVVDASKDPVICGRRMFLAALIIASKFLQDRTYSNRAWARLSGLSVQDVSSYERALLGLLDYRLYVSGSLFDNWRDRLNKLPQQSPNHNKVGPRPGKLSPLHKARSEYAPSGSSKSGLHPPSQPQFSPAPATHLAAPQTTRLREERKIGRSSSNADVTAHSVRKPNFFPVQAVPPRRTAAAESTRKRSDSASSLHNRVPRAGPYATPSMPTVSASSATGSSSSTLPPKASMASLRNASGPGQPIRTHTPLRPASRSGIGRPSSASGQRSNGNTTNSSSSSSHCRPSLPSFSGERPHWLTGHGHHSASRPGLVH